MNSAKPMAQHSSVNLPVEPTVDFGWILVEEGFALAREHEVEFVIRHRERLRWVSRIARRRDAALRTCDLRRRSVCLGHWVCSGARAFG